MEKNNLVYFTKIRDVKSPKRGKGDAGNDFFVPEYTPEFADYFMELNAKYNVKFFYADGELEPAGFVIAPHSQALIPSGIKVIINDPLTYLDAENKSGVATKKSLLVGAQVVDASYRGEVHINVHNVSNDTVNVEFGEKLVQFIQKEYRETEWEEVFPAVYDTLAEKDVEKGMKRGTGGFGSTGV